jgi:hypothetical protein
MRCLRLYWNCQREASLKSAHSQTLMLRVPRWSGLASIALISAALSLLMIDIAQRRV